ncbi:MAG: hypothetical protein ACREOF_13005 [Gemmatimonadales bacterium]
MSSRSSGRRYLVCSFLLAGVLLGGSVWLDRNGTPVVATVSSKREEIAVHDSPRGEWSRWYRVGVKFQRVDRALGTATVTVPRERFDSLRVGDQIAIRYLPAFPRFAQTADGSTAEMLRELGAEFAADSFLTPLLIWLAVGAVGLSLTARIATAAVFAAGSAWTAVALPLLFPAPAPIRLGPAQTTAKVDDVGLITKSPAGRYVRTYGGRNVDLGIRELAKPYQVVRLRFAVPGRPDSVLAVDAVDSASVPGLRAGAILPVRYDPRAPREARLSLGARTFQERNRYHLRVPVIGVGLLVMFGTAGWRARRAASASR